MIEQFGVWREWYQFREAEVGGAQENQEWNWKFKAPRW